MITPEFELPPTPVTYLDKVEGYSLAGRILSNMATTIREYTFCRLVSGLYIDSISFDITPSIFTIYPSDRSLRQLMSACNISSDCKKYLANLPISQPRDRGTPELIEPLQDLAYIIGREANDAFTEDYYPGIESVDALEQEHIEQIMIAMQREMDAESKGRGKDPLVFMTLPPERQRALAERRRYWFSQWGITPDRWATGTWSLWEVSSNKMPQIPIDNEGKIVKYGYSIPLPKNEAKLTEQEQNLWYRYFGLEEG